MRYLKYTLILSMLPLMALGAVKITHGIWVKTNGLEIEAPCPSSYDESGRMRLPRGCQAPVHGVLIKPETYMHLEGNLSALNARNGELNQKLALQESRIQNLELQLSLKVVEPEPCSCGKDFTYGIGLGSIATASACLFIK